MPRRKIIPTDLTLAVRLELLLRPDTNPTGYVSLENAIDYPFEPGAEAWSRVNAWWLADASWLAPGGQRVGRGALLPPSRLL